MKAVLVSASRPDKPDHVDKWRYGPSPSGFTMGRIGGIMGHAYLCPPRKIAEMREQGRSKTHKAERSLVSGGYPTRHL
jgi:hypothetical protein